MIFFTSLALLIVGLLIITSYQVVQADTTDNFIFTIRFDDDNQGADLSNKEIVVLFYFYECEYTDNKVKLIGFAGSVQANTKKAKNPNGQDVTFGLPRNKKFITEVIPITDGSSPANYQRQYYDKVHDLKDVEEGMLLDTSGPNKTRSFCLERGFTIGGSVTKATTNTGIDDIKIKLFDKNKVPVPNYAVTSVSGAYTLRGLSPGQYYLWADGAPKGYVRQFFSSANGFDDAQLVEIGSTNITGKNFSLKNGKSITGKLLNKDDTPFQHLAQVYLLDPVYGIPISMYFHDPNLGHPPLTELDRRINYIKSGGMMDSAYAGYNPDGSYSVGGLPVDAEGWGILMARNATGDYADVYYKDVFFLEKSTLIPFDFDVNTNQVFNLHLYNAGKIKGSVKDLDGNPLAKITVKAIDADNEQYSFSTETDEDGNYTIAGLPTMEYKVQVIDELRHKYLWQYHANKLNFLQATPLNLSEQNLEIDQINFTLKIGGRIAGYVRNEAGEILKDVSIHAFRLGSGSSIANYPVSTTASGIGITDSNGYYEISGLPNGKYILYSRPAVDQNYIAKFYQNSNTVNEADSNTTIGDDPNQLLSGRNFTLYEGGKIEGQITGIPETIITKIKGAVHIGLYDAKTNQAMNATSEDIDPNSDPWSYKIIGVPKGEYKIGISDNRSPAEMLKKYYKESDPNGVFIYKEASSFVIDPAKESDSVKYINFEWSTIGATIKGSVSTDTERTLIQRIKVDAYLVEESTNRLLTTGIYGYTDNDGAYVISGLGKGTYVLTATDETNYIYAREYYSNPNSVTEAFKMEDAQKIIISSMNTIYSPYNFRLSPYGVIKGTVTKGANNDVFANALVYLYNVEETEALYLSTITDKDGEYRFSGLPELKYKVQVIDPDKNFVSRFYTSNTNSYAYTIDQGTELLVDYDQPINNETINICLDQAGAKITGYTQQKEDAAVLTTVAIYLYRKDSNNEWSFVADLGASDLEGNYIIKGLPAGTYKAIAWDYEGNSYPTYYGGSTEPMGDDLVVSAGGEKVANFSLPAIESDKQNEFMVKLEEGLSLFSMPTKIPVRPSLYKANTLIKEWTTVIGAGIINILGFDPETRKWDDLVSNFTLENGKGYLAYSKAPKRIKYYGLIPDQKIDLGQGMNLVGNILTEEGNYYSYDLMKELNTEAGSITRYDSLRGKWLHSTLLWGKSAGDEFLIMPSEGYIINMKSPHNQWSPQQD